MRPRRISEEKIAAIVQRGPEKFTAFMFRLPLSELDNCLRKIQVQGSFRGKDGIKRKILVLFKDLRSPIARATERARITLEFSWAQWVKGEPRVNSPYEAFLASKLFETTPEENLGVACFEFLLEQSNVHKTTRSLAEDFYSYGHFKTDTRVEEILSRFPEKFEETKAPVAPEATVAGEEESESENPKLRVLKEQLGALRTEVRILTEKIVKLGSSLDNEKGRISKAEKAIEQSKNQIKEKSESDALGRKAIATEVKSLEGTVRQLLKTSERQSKQIDAIEKRVSGLGMKLSQSRTEETQQVAAAPVNTRSLTASRKAREVSNLDQLLDLLGNNYYSFGLKGPPSTLLARDVLAALIAGQIPIFVGSFAEELAKATALTFSRNAQVWETDTDLTNSQSFQVAWTWLFDRARRTGSLVVEGINRAPVELFASPLLQGVRGKALASNALQRIVVGTLTSQPGGLPLGTGLTELGPIFLTEGLSWGTPAPDAQIEPADISDGFKFENREAEFDESIEESRSRFDRTSSVVWRGLIRDAHDAVNQLPPIENDRVSGLISGWLVPRAIACGIPQNDVQNLVTELFGSEVGSMNRIKKAVQILGENYS